MTSLSLIEQVRQIPYESILAYHGLTPRREGSTTRPLLDAIHGCRWELAVGFDNDRAGHAGWEHCCKNCALLYPDDPPPSQTLPAGKDWNDDLRMAPRFRYGRRP